MHEYALMLAPKRITFRLRQSENHKNYQSLGQCAAYHQLKEYVRQHLPWRVQILAYLIVNTEKKGALSKDPNVISKVPECFLFNVKVPILCISEIFINSLCLHSKNAEAVNNVNLSIIRRMVMELTINSASNFPKKLPFYFEVFDRLLTELKNSLQSTASESKMNLMSNG
ncbi:hypothetical protein BY458DRAFT_486628 [Sporodiniella umbellata]|nr:hypothetical protein BY458DRAFT_486628 [Sporodiniella umbellata]